MTGALTNIVLDYVFIYPMGAGVAGAAYATVIGQIVSLAIALAMFGMLLIIGFVFRFAFAALRFTPGDAAGVKKGRKKIREKT